MPMSSNDTDPNVHKQPIEVAEDGHLEASASAARQGPRGSKRTMLVLTISFVAALAALGIYWAASAPRLDSADRQPGEVRAAGQKVTDPNVAATFNAPEPQPKQPSATDVAGSSTPAPTPTVPPHPNETTQPAGGPATR